MGVLKEEDKAPKRKEKTEGQSDESLVTTASDWSISDFSENTLRRAAARHHRVKRKMPYKSEPYNQEWLECDLCRLVKLRSFFPKSQRKKVQRRRYCQKCFDVL